MTAQPAQVPDPTPRVVDRFPPVFGALFGVALSLFLATPSDDPLPRVPAFFGGWLLGLLAPRLFRHRFRVLGYVPFLTTAGAVLVAVVQLGFDWCPWAIAGFMFVEGAASGAILRYRDLFRADLKRFAASAAVGVLLGAAAVVLYRELGPTDGQAAYRWALLALSVGLAVLAWTNLLRPTVELAVTPPMWLAYRLRGAGPGLTTLPLTGPVLVIANHASWFDPLLLAFFIPRPIVPMMTASFYDLPVMRWLMHRVFRTIRVEDRTARREAPEIATAIAALDAGNCVVLFPEGYLRRTEDQVVRRFGQGVWQLLKARPQTPVVACWIEGVWGSYFSHYKGPPTKNKKFDVRRPVTIGLSAPEVVPPDVLVGHLAARVYLMNRVLAARAHLGLPEVPPVELPGKEDEEKPEPVGPQS
jgi:1-acyl-sn-glycerol-3-phosphate acyltransferase